MTNKYLLIILFPFLFGCNIKSDKADSNSKQSNDTTYLSLYFIRNDEVNKTTVGEILIFGKYAFGKYFPVTDYDTKTQNPIIERKLILETHKDFTTYYKGQFLTNILIKKVDSSTYDCEELVVGKCNNVITSKLLKKRTSEYSQNRAGGSSGTDFQYTLTDFFAMSSNIAQPANVFPKNQLIDSLQTSLINTNLKTKFKSYYDSLSSNMILDRKFTTRINFKNERFPILVTISTCSDTTKELFMSMLFIFRIDNDKLEPMFEKFENIGTDSWGNGYEFIDAVDIDSDNNPELIFRVDGYEWSGLEIYKYHNGKFNLVFETGLYGC